MNLFSKAFLGVIHLQMEDRIPLEYYSPRILWKTEFHRICGKCTFHQLI